VKRRKPPEPIFVVDENMASSGVEAIQEAGGVAVSLTDYFERGTPDVEFLPKLGNYGQAFVTRDIAMRTNEDERKALALCTVHVFIVKGGGLKLDDLKALVKVRFPKMRRHVLSHGTPFLARVTASDVAVVDSPGRRGGIKR
jgi:hypothetical protein